MIAAALSFGTAVPALAAIDELGAIDVAGDHYTHASWTTFEGPVERLSFLSKSGNVDCDHITVNYRNGITQEVFSGVLYDDQRQSVLFQDGARAIRSIDFACQAESGDGGRITLTAGLGTVPTASSSEPIRHEQWSQIPAPVEPSPVTSAAPMTDMMPLASTDFGRMNSHSIMISGEGQPQLEAIALQPIGADAQCRRITARFDDGSSNDLVVNDGAPLHEGQIYRVDVTGRNRGLNAIGLTCEAENSADVTIKVYSVG
jgi:hypothetical protein